MGISIEQYRAAVGTFANKKFCINKNLYFSLTLRHVILTGIWILFVIILLSGDIELNPGPTFESGDNSETFLSTSTLIDISDYN